LYAGVYRGLLVIALANVFIERGVARVLFGHNTTATAL
jgi:hypothetical protein